MKKVVKLIQLILLVILFGQHVPTTVLAVENDLKDKIHQQVSSLYGFPATIDNSLKEKLPVLLKQFEDKNYLVQSPVKLFNFTDLGIREDAYYPVMIDQRLIALIYYNQETNTYRLEAEDVVKEIGRYNPGLANQTPLIFLIINHQVIGSHKNGISNFSNPTKSSEENQSLLSNIDMSLLDTTISRNIYDETSIFYRKSETISPESSPVSSTSQPTHFSAPASSNQQSRKLTTDTANVQVVAPEMSQNSSLTPKIWSFFSGAMKLSFNQNYKKSLDIAGDKDYYRIDVPETPVGTAYDWYEFYLNSGFDSYGTLYDSTGKEISKNDDGNGNRDFKISIQLSAGTYYLEVRAYNPTATGSYVLRADKITGSDDNYSFETAVDLPLNSDYKAALDFGHATYGGDKDYYQINIPEPPVGAVYDQYDFYLNSNFDSYGTLFDSTGKEISKNDDGNGNRDFKISIQLTPGTYYLEVRAYNTTTTGSYVVRTDRITGSDDNYSFETAVDLPLNSDYKAALDFGHATYGGDKDYYRIDIPESPVGAAYDRYTCYLNSGFDSYGTLYDSTGKEISKNDDGNGNRDFKISIQLTPGTYYLEVRGYNNTATGSYIVRIDRIDRITWSDDNYSFATAVGLPLNSDYKAALDFGHATYGGDKDYYRIDIPASPVGTAYDWYAFYLNSGFDSYGTLYDSTGKEISKNDDGNGNRDFKISIQLSAGTYYLEVRAYNPTATGSYVVRADNVTNRQVTLMKRLAPDQTISDAFRDGVTTFKLYDFYVFESTESVIYTEQEILFNASFGSTAQILNEQHQVLASITGTGQLISSRYKDKLATGHYYIKVGITEPFSLQFKTQTVKNDQNTNFETGPLLTKGTSVSQSIDFGVADKYHDEDFFKVFISAFDARYHTLTLAGVDVVAQLYDEDKEEIGSPFSDKLTDDLPTGMYYVKIRGKHAAVRGNYSLSLKAETNTPQDFKEAVPLSLSDTVEGELSDDTGVKYYKIDVSQLRQLEFYLANSSQVKIEIFNATFQKALTRSWESTNHKTSAAFPQGTYYIKVSGSSYSQYKLLIREIIRKDTEISLDTMNFRTVVKLNGHVNQELTNLYYQLYPNANQFSRSIASDVLDFLDGAMGSWATNIGVYPTMDSLFGTDNVNYYQNIRAKTKGYTYGQYTGDAIGVISGVFEVVSGTAMLAGGKAFGLVASPVTGGGSMAFSIAVIDPIGATITAHGASTATLSVVSFANGHDWNPELSGGRIENPTKSESKIWRGFRNYKNGIKTSGSGKKQKYYKWDHTHNDIEVFDSKRNHLGSMEPTTGEMYKPAVKGRTLGD